MITSYAYTDRGGREVNEDSCIVLEDRDYKCYVLCDGLGGHGKGEVASGLVTGLFKEYYEEGIDKPEEFIGNVLNISQTMLMSEQIAQNARDKMKTTAAALLVADGVVYRGYIGDSRIYIFNKNKVKERTLDHSVPQMLVMSREIKEKEIRNHPDRNKLLKVMGIEWEKPEFQIQEPLNAGDCQAALMCSDGFWELITEKEMCALLKKSADVREWIESMTAVVKKNGVGKNMDNNTAIGIWFK
ncbi:MAG: protein phosphatase 2C domain-containing protein [Butyrivibrio sp.]|nr:protein phosphatase 2C domain-containing protein [Butyrivibrio sp.]